MWSRNFPIYDEAGVIQRVAGVTKDITERKEMETTQFKIAVQQERMKILSDFVRDTSHAFRTPLSLINSKLYLARRTEDAQERERHLNGIEEQAQRILTLVESLVTMIRLDSGIEFETGTVSSSDLLKALEASYRTQIAEAGINLALELEPGLPLIRANLEQLNMALSHLIKNAIQHTAAGGSITLRARLQDDEQLALEVQDTGSGITPEELPRIFDRFYRGSESQNAPGFGLGLPIVARIVEGHGGQITVASKAGQGSTFTILVPLAAHA